MALSSIGLKFETNLSETLADKNKFNLVKITVSEDKSCYTLADGSKDEDFDQGISKLIIEDQPSYRR